jgi:hypothetical protein
MTDEAKLAYYYSNIVFNSSGTTPWDNEDKDMAPEWLVARFLFFFIFWYTNKGEQLINHCKCRLIETICLRWFVPWPHINNFPVSKNQNCSSDWILLLKINLSFDHT